MSRTDQFAEKLTDPSALTIQWAGGSDAGHLKAYDKLTKEKVPKLAPLSFVVLKERNCIDGFLASKGCGARSNEVARMDLEEMTVNYWVDGSPQLLAKGLYKDIKGETEGHGLKYHRAIYAMVTDSPDIETGIIVKLMLKGAAASAWFAASNKKEVSGVVTFGAPLDEQNGAVRFKVPTFVASNPTGDEEALAEVAFDKVEAYLDSRKPEVQDSPAPASADPEDDTGDEILPF